jgi:hypothetical protein
MDHFGLTEAALIRDYLLPLMNATKVQYFADKGIVMDERVVEDNGTRDSAFVHACKLRGMFPKEEGSGPSHLSITLNNIAVTE